MRIGVFQFAPEFGNVAGNVERIAGVIRTETADLWVLPELATTGYLFENRAECASLAESVPGTSTEALATVCRERNTRLVIGIAERSADRVYNSAVYIDPSGVAAVYRKIHLFEGEIDRFDPGPDQFAVHPMGDHRIGMMICYDWMFPESARSLALLGADVIAHPANLVLPYCQQVMPTRALENGVFIVTANRIGTETRAGCALRFTGGSQIVDPKGIVLAKAPANEEAVLLVDVDPTVARDKKITPRNDRLADRRPDLYVLERS